MILNRGHLELDNSSIINHCYQFLNEHNLTDFDVKYGKLLGKLSSIVMAMYLGQKNLKHLMPHHWNELTPLTDVITRQYNNDPIRLSWFNILPPDTFLSAHSHLESKKFGAKHGTVVYYPQLDNGDSPIELLINNEWVPISAKSGDWITFDLECVHRVTVNTSNRPRISFVFDI